MTLKLLGAVFVITGAGGFGFAMASAYRRTEQAFRQYLIALDYLECDLSFRLTPLPQLCRSAANAANGPVRALFLQLEQELECQIYPDVRSCTRAAIALTPCIPKELAEQFSDLGTTLGEFDLPGQLKGIRAAQERAHSYLNTLSSNRSGRLRSYQTLGLCAGAALAILFL